MKIQVKKDKEWIDHFLQKIENNQLACRWELFQLQYNLQKNMRIEQTDQLICLPHVPIEEVLPHQLLAAKQVIFQMNGRAILADEVGLGKTIEAGLILKEYIERKMVKKALLLVPAGLIEQWAFELTTKFQLAVTVFKKNYRWEDSDIMIASIDTAKKEPHRSHLYTIAYDFVLVDEAHQLKNHQTVNYQFIDQLDKKYCLLLTATPLQNNEKELINLISIIQPAIAARLQAKTVKENANEQRRLLQSVLIRNRREDVFPNDTKRHVEIEWVMFSKKERMIYESLTQLIRKHPSPVIQQHYIKAFCSSREACYLSLQQATETFEKKTKDIQKEIEQLAHHSKAVALVNYINKYPQEKILIFTQYYATQFYLLHYLHSNNIAAVGISGKMKHGQKAWATNLFKEKIDILIATEAGQEGLNMQFCHRLINYDLPWNPLKIEQRIGRINRIGQKHAITIVHFLMKHSIEENMLNKLHHKINIFTDHIGHLDAILMNEGMSMPNESHS